METVSIEFSEIDNAIRHRFPGVMDWAIEFIQRQRIEKASVEKDTLIAKLTAESTR